MKCDTCRYKNDCFVFDKKQMEKCKAYEPEKKKTNADRIRAMNDEDLARWLDNFFWGHKKANLFGLLKWLRYPAEED